jgi:CBS domain-containing protein
LVAAALRRQAEPVHRWTTPGMDELGEDQFAETLAAVMTTDLFTVSLEDPVTLAASIMEWRHVHHVPVEDESRFVGLLTAEQIAPLELRACKVGEIVQTHPVTAAPETPMAEAWLLMQEHRVDCLPVLAEGRLVGLVTVHDLQRDLQGQGLGQG